MRFLARIGNTDRGATMVEYGLIVGVISLMSLSAVTLVGETTSDSFDKVTVALDDGSTSTSVDSGSEASSGDSNNGVTTTTTAPTTTTTTLPPTTTTTTTLPPTTTTTAPTTTTTISPEGTLETGSTSATLTSWKKNKGSWDASVEYSNDWEYDQYLTLLVTEIDHTGNTKTITVEDFPVPAGGKTTFNHADNSLRKKKSGYTGVVEVKIEVVGVTIMNQGLDEMSYDVEGDTVTIDAPTP
jgi:Flp pilus assembly pilin Flp